MFAAGYEAEVIKRWGRWQSDNFAVYLWNGERVLSSVGKGMLSSAGLFPQLQRQSLRDIDKNQNRSTGRAGGKGWKGGNNSGLPDRERLFRISKKLSRLRRNDRHVFRQRDGFVSLADILNSFRWPEFPGLRVAKKDLGRVIRGEGGNRKMRSEWGTVKWR